MQKGQGLILILVGVLVIAVAAGGAYYFGKSQVLKPQNPVVISPASTPQRGEQTQQPTYPDTNKNEFNINAIKVGDNIGSMTVISIEPYDNSGGSISDSNVKVSFKGKSIITGSISCSSDSSDPGLNHIVMNNLDIISKAKVPKMQGEINAGYIDFNSPTSNAAKIACKNKIGEQTTVTIDNFILNSHTGAMLNNYADLVDSGQ